MNLQQQIFNPQVIERIQNVIAQNTDLSRTKLSQQMCQMFNWRSANGSLKEVSCRKALLRLQDAGHIKLPKAQKPPPEPGQNQQECCEPIHEHPIEADLKDLGDIEIVPLPFGDQKTSRLWNTLMNSYHYLGAGKLCGAQLRYLFYSCKGDLLGALAFSSAAWKIKPRDQWIGWDAPTRQKNLHQVVSNSRFLILPWVKVENLASHVLSQCIKRLNADWYQRYGIRILLLETFVEEERFKGSCYKASNWILVGQTKGRGRQDRFNTRSLAIKAIYLYPLRKDAAHLLSEGRQKPKLKRPQPQNWVEQEFGGAQLGDARRQRRLVEIARDFGERPGCSIPQACQTRARTKAAYRFLEDTNHTMDKLLAPHYESTLNRIRQQQVVLAAQDTTSLNYSTHPATQDLGLIGSKRDGAVGLIVHDTMCFNTAGTPLGLMDVQMWARDPADFGKKHLRAQMEIEQKESNKWMKSYNSVADAQRRCRDTLLVSVGDREADIYELFDLALREPQGPKLLVRAEHKRMLAENQGSLWEHIAGLPIGGRRTVHVPRRRNHKARTAQLEIRYATVKLKPPKNKPKLPNLTIRAILAEEKDCEAGCSPLKWMLLTTCEVNTFEQAVEKLDWYCLRWGIEVFHRTLKSGCKIENRQLGSADRIESCLAIDMVIAWRIYHLTKLSRETPDARCTVFFKDSEWKALLSYKTRNPILPKKPPTLREMTRMVASLGGFLGRKCDGEPGTQTVWLGLQRLEDLASMWEFLMSHSDPDQKNKPPPGVQCPGSG